MKLKVQMGQCSLDWKLKSYTITMVNTKSLHDINDMEGQWRKMKLSDYKIQQSLLLTYKESFVRQIRYEIF